MKNTVKKIIAVVLAFAMLAAVGSVYAFAAESKTLQWNAYGPDDGREYYEVYEYAGIASEGKMILPSLDDNEYYKSIYYDFNVVNAGYYLITTSSDGWGSVSPRFPELFENGVAYGDLEGKWLGYDENDAVRYLYCLEAGQTVLGFEYWDDININITIEYFGESISDIQIDEKYLDCIVNEDVRDYGDGEGCIYNTEAVITFSSGKTIENDDFDIKLERDLTKGVNNVEFCLLNYSKPVVINVFEATDFVTKLEMSNIEKYLTRYESYTGDYLYDYNINETMTVTLANGETKTVQLEYGYGEITLSNGRTYGVHTFWDDMTLSLVFADHKYVTYDIECVPADFSGNLDELKNENSYWIDSVNCDAQNRLNQMKYTDDIGEKLSLLFWIPAIYSNLIFQIFCNVVEFIEFYASV